MPVRMAEQVGLTRDVSVGGIYFELDSSAAIGSSISFDIELETSLGKMTLKCNGQVVRTEQQGNRTGIAVRMMDSKFEAVCE
jgi:hypothetical protein